MGSVTNHVVVVDFPGIKKYVFGTDRLVEIRGASALLDWLNREKLPDQIKTRYPGSASRCIFVGGGSGQFIINDSPEGISQALYEIQGLVYGHSCGALRLVSGIAPLDDNFPAALQQAFIELQYQKQQNPPPQSSAIHSGFVRECDSCSGVAEVISKYAGDEKILCRVCKAKEDVGKQRGLWEGFSRYLNDHGKPYEQALKERPEDFEKIGNRCQTKHGYTALVYGDGNSMGRIVKQIDSENRFHLFSTIVDSAVREACHEALSRCCPPVQGKIPADILLLGGDDVMIYLAADRALLFAIEVARLFEVKTKALLSASTEKNYFASLLGNKGLTISLGIAYGRSHTPIAIMVDQAEELLSSAKKRGSSLSDANGTSLYTTPCIDFHFTSRFNQLSVIDSRKEQLEFETSRGEALKLYGGPYTLEEAQLLHDHAQQLSRSGIPRSKIRRLGHAPFLGKVFGAVETLTVYGRMQKAEHKNVLLQAMDKFNCANPLPWNTTPEQISTVMVDLVSLSELTSST